MFVDVKNQMKYNVLPRLYTTRFAALLHTISHNKRRLFSNQPSGYCPKSTMQVREVTRGLGSKNAKRKSGSWHQDKAQRKGITDLKKDFEIRDSFKYSFLRSVEEMSIDNQA